MPLVQLPILGHRNPQTSHRLQRQVQRFDCPCLHAGKGCIRRYALRLHQLSCRPSFGCTFFSYVDIPPAGEPVFQIPLRLAVTDEDEFRHFCYPKLFVGALTQIGQIAKVMKPTRVF